MLIYSHEDMAKLVQTFGFLPFSKNSIKGFSVEEHTPPHLWFADNVPGPWEWKGPVLREIGCAYGKFFNGRPGFISREWFLDFANYRRDGYDFDSRYNDGLVRHQDKAAYDILRQHSSLISKEWRRLTGTKNRGTFDSVVSRLQMTGYVITEDFEYSTAKNGIPYGWGLARYTTPELYFGNDFSAHVYDRSPSESKKKMIDHLSKLLKDASEKQISAVIS